MDSTDNHIMSVQEGITKKVMAFVAPVRCSDLQKPATEKTRFHQDMSAMGAVKEVDPRAGIVTSDDHLPAHRPVKHLQPATLQALPSRRAEKTGGDDTRSFELNGSESLQTKRVEQWGG